MSLPRAFWAAVWMGAVLWVGFGTATDGRAQPDSVRAEILKAKGFSPDHSPRKALWRAAAVPGWGQLYNRQYLKIPFVYAGFAALGVRVYRAHQRYKLFQRAHLYGIGRRRAGEDEANEYQQYQGQYDEVEEFVGTQLSESRKLQEMRDQRDQFRRRRDLSILGTGAFYALTLLDAYVSAHLLTFDVGDTLSMRLRPDGPTAGTRGFEMRLQVRF